MNDAVAALWRERLEDFSGSGLPLKNWCELRGVSVQQVYYWRRRLAQGNTPGGEVQSERWLAVTVADPVAAVTGAIKLHVGALTLEIEPGFQPATLRAVLETLGVQPRC